MKNNKLLSIVLILIIGFKMAAKSASLAQYRKKRNFEKTTEPKPKIKKTNSKKTIFVVQKHAASHLHYDFRLEINGVLKSWAIPKGPSSDPNEKHLAVETEDHPIDYANFEGVIPEGEYGGGTVMVFDIGNYKNLRTKDMPESYKEGKIEVELDGKKLKGNYVLVKTSFQGKKNNWIFKKMLEPKKRKNINLNSKSALTGRTMNQITKDSKLKD